MSVKEKAILKFTERFEGSHKSLGPSDVDYRVYDKQGNLIAFALVIPTDKLNLVNLPGICLTLIKSSISGCQTSNTAI